MGFVDLKYGLFFILLNLHHVIYITYDDMIILCIFVVTNNSQVFANFIFIF